MAVRSRRSSSVVRTPRRKTSWAIGPATGTDGSEQNVSGSGPVIAGVGAAAGLDGLTVVRLRGSMLVYLSSATTAFDGYTGAFGIGKVTSPAFTAGIASVPTPLTEEDWDGWVYHRYFNVRASGPIVAAAVSLQTDGVDPTVAAFRWDIDSKAMRKFDITETMFAAIEVTITGTAVLRWSFNSRMLVKLP